MKFTFILLFIFPLVVSADMSFLCNDQDSNKTFDITLNEVNLKGFRMMYMKVVETNTDFTPKLVSTFEGFATKQSFKDSTRVTYLLLDEIPTDNLGSGVSITYDTANAEQPYIRNGSANLLNCTKL